MKASRAPGPVSYMKVHAAKGYGGQENKGNKPPPPKATRQGATKAAPADNGGILKQFKDFDNIPDCAWGEAEDFTFDDYQNRPQQFYGIEEKEEEEDIDDSQAHGWSSPRNNNNNSTTYNNYNNSNSNNNDTFYQIKSAGDGISPRNTLKAQYLPAKNSANTNYTNMNSSSSNNSQKQGPKTAPSKLRTIHHDSDEDDADAYDNVPDIYENVPPKKSPNAKNNGNKAPPLLPFQLLQQEKQEKQEKATSSAATTNTATASNSNNTGKKNAIPIVTAKNNNNTNNQQNAKASAAVAAPSSSALRVSVPPNNNNTSAATNSNNNKNKSSHTNNNNNDNNNNHPNNVVHSSNNTPSNNAPPLPCEKPLHKPQPSSPKSPGKLSPEDQLCFLKQPRAVSDFKPYTLAQYKAIKPTHYQEITAKLQPDLNTEELILKRKNQARIKEFSQQLRTVNAEILTSQPKKLPSASEQQDLLVAQAKYHSHRMRALEFAKHHIPKPKLPHNHRNNLNNPDSERDYDPQHMNTTKRSHSAGDTGDYHYNNSSSRGYNNNNNNNNGGIVMDEDAFHAAKLQELEAKHQQSKARMEAIKKSLHNF